MRITKTFIILFSQLLLLPLFGLHEGNCSLHKKESRVVHRTFGENALAEQFQISAEKALALEQLNPGDCIYRIAEAGEIRGYLLSTRAKGRYDYFDYCIVYAENLSIVEVVITVYRSDHGAAVCQKGWLSQFAGYNGGELKLGSDIDAVSGGTISSSSIVEDIQRCQLLMSSLLDK